ncbi:MAG: response regulator [Myxococcota bacterium]
MSHSRILCVDDEQNVLDGLRRNLRRDFDVTIALGGAEGLKVLESEDFEVVVSDYQMPEMSGAEFLGQVRERWPHVTRILLTGNADLDAAIKTVNEGHVYRFLLKPCPKEVLIPALKSACELNRLVRAEQVLLQDTLHGAVRLLMDALSLVSPDAFGHCGQVASRAGEIASDLGVDEPWKVEMAALLAQVTLVTLPTETAEKLRSGEELSRDERQMVERLPAVGSKLLAPLPRIEDVCELVEQQGAPWGAGARPETNPSLGASVLRACIDAELVAAQGVPFAAVIHTLKQRKDFYPESVLECLERHPPDEADQGREISAIDVVAGMVLLDPIQSVDGRLLVASGSTLTTATVERIRNFCTNTEIKEPIRVMGG